jgi:hypothetical protein
MGLTAGTAARDVNCQTSCLHRASIVSKRFIVPTDAHYYKFIEMLKQFKIITIAPTCFGSRRNHHQGAALCLAKTTECFFFVLVGIDAVNVMAAYQPVAPP